MQPSRSAWLHHSPPCQFLPLVKSWLNCLVRCPGLYAVHGIIRYNHVISCVIWTWFYESLPEMTHNDGGSWRQLCYPMDVPMILSKQRDLGPLGPGLAIWALRKERLAVDLAMTEYSDVIQVGWLSWGMADGQWLCMCQSYWLPSGNLIYITNYRKC